MIASILEAISAAIAVAGLAVIVVQRRALAEVRAELSRTRWRADHDPLTGLANRYQLEQVVSEWLAQQRPVVLAMVDLDNLHRLNRSHGYAAGDQILRHAADRLTQISKPQALVARLGGDEFVIAWPDVSGDEGYGCAVQAYAYLAAEPVDLGRRQHITVEASVGVADTSGCDWISLSGLLRRADEAVCYAKLFRNTVIGWDEELSTRTTGMGRVPVRLRDRRRQERR